MPTSNVKKQFTDYFSCINGDCESCIRNTNSVFGCNKYGICDYCIAKLTKFCEACTHCNDFK